MAAVVLAGAPAALANTTRSANWAGYAVHRTGVSFHQVSGTWTQPDATCVAGRPTYSAVWVGLGGYSLTSNALEQIGTEVDCNAAGHAISTAWYELVPAPSRPISFTVEPGDVMHATVTVAGHRIVLELDNLTEHRRFHRTFQAHSVDVSSAEWIVEAPSECVGQFACQALPLANFGSVPFSSASVASAAGPAGSIADTAWGRTRIELTPGGQRFIVARNTSDVAGTAVPSPLRDAGTAFDVTYGTTAVAPAPGLARDARARAGYIVH